MKFKIFFLYFFLIIYSVEILLNVFINEKGISQLDVKNERIKIAQKKNLEIDIRNKKDVFLELLDTNKELSTGFNFAPTFRFSNVFQTALTGNELIPFRGPINKDTLLCAEDLNYRIAKNDKYGFKNYNSVYEKKINTIILGDSFAEGKCLDNKNDTSAFLIKKGYNTVNLGVSGSSTLLSLGILREFGNYFKPKNVIYFYYEGNDLEGLSWEKQIPILKKYYDNENFNNDYLLRYKEVKKFLDLVNEETLKSLKETKTKSQNKKSVEKVIEKLQDILELKISKKIIRENILKKEKKIILDENILINAVKKMYTESQKIKSNFIFVYIPDKYTFFDNEKSFILKQSIKKKEKIIYEIENLGVKVIDLKNILKKHPNPKSLYPLEYPGHFNSDGYEEIAKNIYKHLKK